MIWAIFIVGDIPRGEATQSGEHLDSALYCPKSWAHFFLDFRPLVYGKPKICRICRLNRSVWRFYSKDDTFTISTLKSHTKRSRHLQNA